MTLKIFLSLTLIMALLTTFTSQTGKPEGGDPELAKKIARFAPTTLTADVSKLSAKDRQALDKIIAAAKLLDPLFLRQVWSGNDALRKSFLPTRLRPVANDSITFISTTVHGRDWITTNRSSKTYRARNLRRPVTILTT